MSKRSKKRNRSPEASLASASPIPTPKTSAVEIEEPDWKWLLQALLIAAVSLWIYWPSFHGGWLWDDDSYITENPLLHSASGLWDIWFQPGSSRDYYPVEESVLWAEWHLWGLDTLGYHLLNVALHIVSSLLVWRLLAKFGLRLAWLGGLLFAIHPVQVESVAWMAELKNTLSLPALLLAMILYLDYDERGSSRDYWLAVGLFLVAVLCKLSVVLLPVVILLHAWWKHGRIAASDLKASGPFFAVALGVGLVTMIGGIWAKQFTHLPVHFLPADGIWGRLVLAGLAFAFYFSKAVLPVDLMTVYPLWRVDPASPAQYLPWLVLGLVVFWFWRRRQTWGRDALLGLGFFIINLAPCPGFIPAPNMGYAWVMDHFLYLPLIGLIGLVVAGCEKLEARLPRSARFGGVGIVAVIMALLAIESRGYAKLYLNSETLWTRTLELNPQTWPGHNNLGRNLHHEGRYLEAIAQYQQALQIEPGYAEAHYNMGLSLQQTGRLPEAIAQYQQALAINPDYAKAHNDLGNALLLAGRMPEAIDQYQQALRLRPDYAEAHNNLGSAMQRMNRLPEAIDQYQRALRFEPDDAEAHYNLGLGLQQTGRLAEAIDQYREAVRLKPDDVQARRHLDAALLLAGGTSNAGDQHDSSSPIQPDDAQTHFNRGLVLQQSGQLPEAITEYHQAIQINPDDAKAHYNLGNALVRTSRIPEAIAQYQEVLRIEPNSIQAHNNLAAMFAKTGRIPEAIQQLQAAQQIDPNNSEVANNLAKLQAIQESVPAKP